MAIYGKKGPTAHKPGDAKKNAIACAARILLTLNLKIWNAAIHSTLVVRDVVKAALS